MRTVSIALVLAVGVGCSSSDELEDGECLRSRDCTTGDVCASGVCRTLCVGNADCDSGGACLEGQCRGLCDEDTDCFPGERCTISAVCAPVSTEPPRIESVDSNGSADGRDGYSSRRLASELVINGDNLFEATRMELVGDESIALDIESRTGTQLRAVLPTSLMPGEYTLVVANQNGTDSAQVTLLQGERGPSGCAERIVVDTELRVPSQYANVQAALNFLDDLDIASSTTVTILIESDQTYSDAIVVNHARSDRIEIVGSEEGAKPTLTFDGVSGFRIEGGRQLMLIDNLVLVGTDNGRSTGVETSDASSVRLGGEIEVQGFFRCLVASRNGVINADNTTLRGCANAVYTTFGGHVDIDRATVEGTTGNGVFANYGSTIRAVGAIVSSPAGHGILAQNGSMVLATSATVTSAASNGVYALSHSFVFCDRCTVSGSGQNGIAATNVSMANATRATSTGNDQSGVFSSRGSAVDFRLSSGVAPESSDNQNWGARADQHSYIIQTGAVFSDNGLGETSPALNTIDASNAYID